MSCEVDDISNSEAKIKRTRSAFECCSNLYLTVVRRAPFLLEKPPSLPPSLHPLPPFLPCCSRRCFIFELLSAGGVSHKLESLFTADGHSLTDGQSEKGTGEASTSTTKRTMMDGEYYEPACQRASLLNVDGRMGLKKEGNV